MFARPTEKRDCNCSVASLRACCGRAVLVLDARFCHYWTLSGCICQNGWTLCLPQGDVCATKDRNYCGVLNPQDGCGNKDCVRKLQTRLNSFRENLPCLENDGCFGPKTLQAVKTYQSQNGLKVSAAESADAPDLVQAGDVHLTDRLLCLTSRSPTVCTITNMYRVIAG